MKKIIILISSVNSFLFKREYIIVSIILGAILLATFYPLVKGYVLFPSDLLNNLYYPYCGRELSERPDVVNHYVNDAVRLYYPAKVFLKETLDKGRFPFWNRYVFGGYPFYSHSMFGVFDPFNIFLMFTEINTAIELGVIVQLLMAGLSMFMLVRYYRISFWGSLISGIGYMMNGLFICTIYHEWMISAFCWMPLIFLFYLKWVDSNNPKYFTGAALCMAGAHLGGSLQVSFYVIVGMCLFIFYFRFVLNNINNKQFVMSIALIGISVLLSGFMLFPTIQSFFLDASGRTHGTRGFHHLWHIATAVPVLFVNFLHYAMIGSVRGFELIKFWDSDIAEFNAFCGYAVAFFALWAFLKSKHFHVRFYLIMALTAFLLPLLTPLYSYIYYRIMILFVFSACVVSGFGFDSFIKHTHSASKKKFISVFIGIALFMFCALIIIQLVISGKYNQIESVLKDYVLKNSYNKFFGAHQGFYLGRVEYLLDYFSLANPYMLVSYGVIFGTLGVGFLSVRKKLSLRYAGLIIGILLSIEMTVSARNYLVMCNPDKYPLYKNLAIVDAIKEDNGIYRVFINGKDVRALPYFTPNILSVYGVETTQGEDSFYPDTMKFYNITLADLMNAKYIISYAALNDSRTFELIYEDILKLYRNKEVMPRAFCLYDYTVVRKPKAQLDILHNTGFNHRTTAVVSETPPFQPVKNVPYNAFSIVSIPAYGQDSLTVEVDSSKDCLLVISNTYSPGWEASVDGLPAKIQRVDYALQGISLGQGKHVVSLKFNPRIFYISGLVSLGCLICLLMWCSIWRISRSLNHSVHGA